MNLLRKIMGLRVLRKYLPATDIAVALKGSNVNCICCGGSFITFLPFGLIKRANASCPSCGSLERHRLHWHFMVNKTDLLKSTLKLRILHVAPEAVFYNKFNGNHLFDYTPCAKFGEGFTDEYPEGTIDADITKIQFEANSFDDLLFACFRTCSGRFKSHARILQGFKTRRMGDVTSSP